MSKKEILFSVTKKDLEITWFSGTGAGGQHRNKHQNCCRIKHKDTGIIVTGQNERSREQNLKFAFRSLCSNPQFVAYLKIKSNEALYGKQQTEKEIMEAVEKAVDMSNLKIEYFDPEEK